MLLLTFLALAAAVRASLDERGVHPYPNQCSDVKSVVAASHCQLAAAKFCSSYLHVSQHTSIVTTTSTSTSVKTITLPGIPTKTTTTITETSTDTTVVTPLCTVPSPGGTKVRRGAAAVREPRCLSTFAKGPALSSACSCLSIPQGTVTSTTTVVASTASRTTITLSAATITIKETTTVTSTSTSTDPLATPTGQFYIYNAAAGNYGALNGGLGQLFLSYYFDISSRVSFTLNALGNLLVGSVNDNGYQGAVGDVTTGVDPSYVIFDFAADLVTLDRAAITCGIQTNDDAGTCVLNCVDPEGGSDDGYIGLAKRWTLGDGQLTDGGDTGVAYTPYVVDVNS